MHGNDSSPTSDSTSFPAVQFNSELAFALRHGPGVRSAGLTDVGRKRGDNQDQFLIAELRKSMLVHSTSLPLDPESTLFGGGRGHVLVVADGMGGHAGGRRASSVAIEHLIAQLLNHMHWFLQPERDSQEDFLESLKTLLKQAHARILAESDSQSSNRGMGTTLTMAHIAWQSMHVVHAGDSRCYLVRDGVCKQLTTDHTLAHQLVEAGGLKPEEEAGSRWSNVLWNVLGGNGDKELLAEVQQVDLQAGDTVILCSDGLSRYVNEASLASVVVECGEDVHAMTRRLVDLANDAGGEDNVTVVCSQPIVTNQLEQKHLLERSVPLVDLDDESDLRSADGRRLTQHELRSFANEETLPDRT